MIKWYWIYLFLAVQKDQNYNEPVQEYSCPPTPQTVSDDNSVMDVLMLDDNSIINLDIIKEEERLAKENEARQKKEQLELERKRRREEAAKEEEALAKQREAEQRDRRYKRLMHLLKSSKMYSSMLKDKIETEKTEKQTKGWVCCYN